MFFLPLLAFEPLTCAIGATLLEQMIKRPSRVCVQSKMWLRRAPDIIFDNAANEAADPVLDLLNGMHTMLHLPTNPFFVSSVFAAVLIATILYRRNIFA
jgi:hypothetical protein